jgi:hypothetical protein
VYHEDFAEAGDSTEALLESFAADGYESRAPVEVLEEFVARTPQLSAQERADILSDALGAETDWGRTGRDVQQWSQFGQNLLQLAGGLAQQFGGQTGQDVGRALNLASMGVGTVGGLGGGLMQQFGRPQPGQVPPLQSPPGPQAPPRPGGLPVGGLGGFSGGVPNPQANAFANMTGMLQQLMSNPQLQAALARGVVGGSNNRREVVLEIAGHEGNIEEVAIPLGAAVNAVAVLAHEALMELNASTHESDPEVPDYLVSESGEYIVDPARADHRAALVIEYFRRAREAERAGLAGGAGGDWGAFEDDELGGEWSDEGRW